MFDRTDNTTCYHHGWKTGFQRCYGVVRTVSILYQSYATTFGGATVGYPPPHQRQIFQDIPYFQISLGSS